MRPPLFHTFREFNRAYLDGQVYDKTRLIRPSAIGAFPDDKAHHVSFRDQTSKLVRCSAEPEELDARPQTWDDLWDEITRHVATRHETVSLDTIEELNRDLRDLLEEFDIDARPTAADTGPRRRDGPLGELAYLSRTFFEACLCGVHRPRQSVVDMSPSSTLMVAISVLASESSTILQEGGNT